MATCPNPSRNITAKIRAVGVDDGAFHADEGNARQTLLLAVLFQDLHISTLRVGFIQVDGRDANRVLASLLRPIAFDVIMLSGISFAGFNLVDINQLARDTRRPVVAVTGERPDNHAVRKALRGHFDDWKDRWQMVSSAGRLYSCKPLRDEPKLYFEVRGASPDFAREVIRATAVISRLPEPIRVARILARGLSTLIQTSFP